MNPEDRDTMLVSALRYAIGRQTYIVHLTCDIIGGSNEEISAKALRTMRNDLQLGLQMLAPDSMERPDLKRLLTRIELEIESRE